MYDISKSEISRWKNHEENPRKKSMIQNVRKILDVEEESVVEYRTLSDENREMGYRKFAWKMIDEDIVYLTESSVYRILKKFKLLG